MPNIHSLYKKSKKKIHALRETIARLRSEREKQEKKIQTEKAPPEKPKEEIELHFSMLSVAKATILIISLIVMANFLGEISHIILLFFISLLFAAALDPTIDKLETYKIPRSISVLGIFFLLVVLLIFFVSQLIPLLATQLIELARNISSILDNLTNDPDKFFLGETIHTYLSTALSEIDRDQLTQFLDTFGKQLESFAGNTYQVIISLFNGIFNFVLVLILTFFLIVDERSVDGFFISLFPSKHGKYIVEKLEIVKKRVGYWLHGQVTLMFIVFIITWLVFLILGVEYALTLGMMAGVTELIPVIGPFISGIPAGLVAFNQSPLLLLEVVIFIIVMQQVEGSILVPLVMKKAVGLSPIIIILSLLIGWSQFELIGAIIAVPVVTTLSIFVSDYTTKEK
jgi:predicted PurR-regulated permease PerM